MSKVSHKGVKLRKFDKSFPRVPCTQKDLDFLEKKSAQSGISKSQFLRNAVYFTSINQIDKEFQKRQLYLLSNLTNNINQLARHCNIKKRVDQDVLIKLGEILEFSKAIK